MGKIIQVVKSNLIRKCQDCEEEYKTGALIQVTHKFDFFQRIEEFCYKCAKKREIGND